MNIFIPYHPRKLYRVLYCLIILLVIIFGAVPIGAKETINSSSSYSTGWNCRKYCPYIAAAAIGAGLFAYDKSLNTFSQKSAYHSTSADDFFKPLNDYGQFGPYIAIVPALAAYGLIGKNNRCLSTAGELIVGLAAAELVTGGAKIIMGRKRPFETGKAYEFFKGGRSFWSGHTVTTATFATIISKRFPRQNLGFIGIDHDLPIVPVLAYSYTSLMAIERLYANDHWASDVYFGAIAGYAIGSLTVHFSNKIQAGRLKLKTNDHVYVVYEISFN